MFEGDGSKKPKSIEKKQEKIVYKEIEPKSRLEQAREYTVRVIEDQQSMIEELSENLLNDSNLSTAGKEKIRDLVTQAVTELTDHKNEVNSLSLKGGKGVFEKREEILNVDQEILKMFGSNKLSEIKKKLQQMNGSQLTKVRNELADINRLVKDQSFHDERGVTDKQSLNEMNTVSVVFDLVENALDSTESTVGNQGKDVDGLVDFDKDKEQERKTNDTKLDAIYAGISKYYKNEYDLRKIEDILKKVDAVVNNSKSREDDVLRGQAIKTFLFPRVDKLKQNLRVLESEGFRDKALKIWQTDSELSQIFNEQGAKDYIDKEVLEMIKPDFQRIDGVEKMIKKYENFKPTTLTDLNARKRQLKIAAFRKKIWQARKNQIQK